MQYKKYRIAAATQALFVSFLLTTLLIPSLRQDLNPIDNAISHYLVGPFGWLAVTSFIFLGLGAFSALFIARESQKAGKYFLATLLTYSLGVIVAGISHPDSTVHGFGAAVAFGLVPIMVLQATMRLRYTWFFLIVGSFLFWPILPFGIAERITTFLEVAWLIYFTHKAKLS